MREVFDAFMTLVTAIMFAMIMLAVATYVHAHDWYPMECCHQQDCAPVDSATSEMPPMVEGMSLVPPLMVVTTRFGSAVVPYNFKMRQSPDGRMHACIINGQLVCLFMPPSM